MPVLRGKFLAAVHQALDAEHLTLPPGVTFSQLRMLLNRLGRAKWHVQIMTRYAHGKGVATYLARYLRGGPIKNARLVAFNGARVTFLHRTRQEGTAAPQRITLPVADFLQRWLLHVPMPQTRVVR